MNASEQLFLSKYATARGTAVANVFAHEGPQLVKKVFCKDGLEPFRDLINSTDDMSALAKHPAIQGILRKDPEMTARGFADMIRERRVREPGYTFNNTVYNFSDPTDPAQIKAHLPALRGHVAADMYTFRKYKQRIQAGKTMELPAGLSSDDITKFGSNNMTAAEQLFLSRGLIKAAFADAVLGETKFDKITNGLSFLPGIGFAGNYAQAGKNLMHGQIWKGLGNAALGTASLFTGGAANDAVKGVGLAAKYLPTFMKGRKALQGIGNATHSLPGVSSAPFQALGKSKPMQWMGNNYGKSQLGVGVGTSMLTKDPMAGKDRAFNNLTGAASGASNVGSMLGGGNQDPRYLSPPATPAPFSPMFHG